MAEKPGPHAVTNGCDRVGTDHAVIKGSAEMNSAYLYLLYLRVPNVIFHSPLRGNRRSNGNGKFLPYCDSGSPLARFICSFLRFPILYPALATLCVVPSKCRLLT